ncbi:MAG: prepilin peptidase [Anaerolineales bacterium]|nr:prepilin peptidase [Anaerolineales bacterium]
MTLLSILLALIVGFLAGVLVNALADSMPYFRRPRLPLYPPSLKAEGELPLPPPRPYIAWSGLIAYLTGNQTHTASGNALRLRHPIVEVFMALFFGYAAANWPNHERLVIWMIYLTILMLVTIIDIEHYLILFPVIIPALLIALVVAVVFPESDRQTSDYLIGAVVGGGLYLVMFWGGGLFAGFVSSARGQQLDEVAFGFGDVLLATLCGLMIGWQAFIFASLITVIAGAVGALLFIVGRLLVKRQYDFFTPLPYGPYIVLGTVIMMLWREEIRNFLTGG